MESSYRLSKPPCFSNFISERDIQASRTNVRYKYRDSQYLNQVPRMENGKVTRAETTHSHHRYTNNETAYMWACCCFNVFILDGALSPVKSALIGIYS